MKPTAVAQEHRLPHKHPLEEDSQKQAKEAKGYAEAGGVLRHVGGFATTPPRRERAKQCAEDEPAYDDHAAPFSGGLTPRLQPLPPPEATVAISRIRAFTTISEPKP